MKSLQVLVSMVLASLSACATAPTTSTGTLTTVQQPDDLLPTTRLSGLRLLRNDSPVPAELTIERTGSIGRLALSTTNPMRYWQRCEHLFVIVDGEVITWELQVASPAVGEELEVVRVDLGREVVGQLVNAKAIALRLCGSEMHLHDDQVLAVQQLDGRPPVPVRPTH